MNGGVNATTNPATYTVESAAINLAAPTRAGYNFTALDCRAARFPQDRRAKRRLSQHGLIRSYTE